MDTIIVHMPSPFPFHGIFSSLGSNPPSEAPSFEGTLDDDTTAEKATSAKAARGAGQVAVDIYEHDNYYIIKAPIAGVRLSDLDIEITDNVIVIRGTRAQTDQVPNDQYYLQECFWGEFSRKITLPFPIDPKKIKATFNKECILKILVPKEEKVKIVRINEV